MQLQKKGATLNRIAPQSFPKENLEPTPETHKIKKVSFGDLYIFFN